MTQAAVGTNETRSDCSSREGADGRQAAFRFWTILCGFLLFWVVLSAFGAPRGAGVDIFVYKDPGCNLATGRGFTAWGMPGTADLDRHLFASNGPAIPFLFGIAASLFGCTGRVNTFFELGFAAAGVFGAACLLAPVWRRRPLLSAVLIGLALPSGLIYAETDRPGVPGFAIFTLACLAAGSGSRPVRLLLAPLAAGICALFFPLGGALTGLAVWVLEAGVGPPRPAALARLAAGLLGVFLVPIALVVALYAALDPTAGARFLGNALGPGGGAGAVLHAGYFRSLRAALFDAGLYSVSLVLSFALVAGTIAVAAWRQAAWRGADLILLAGLAGLALVTLLVFPKQSDYMAWCRTALVVLMAASCAPFAIRARRGGLVEALLVIVCLVNLPFVFLEAMKQVETRDSYVVAGREAAAFAAELGQLPGLVAVPSGLYFIYRPLLPEAADLDVLGHLVHDPSEVAGLAACYRGSLDGRPVGRDDPMLPPLTLLSSASSHFRLSLFGISLSRAEWGWSCDHYVAQR